MNNIYLSYYLIHDSNEMNEWQVSESVSMWIGVSVSESESWASDCKYNVNEWVGE